MAAITLAPTPPKGGLGLGYFVGLKNQLAAFETFLADSTSDGTTANTLAEIKTFIDAVINALDG